MRQFISLILFVTLVAPNWSCTQHRDGDQSAPTMIANPIGDTPSPFTGATTTVVANGTCGQYQLCCQQLFSSVAAASVHAPSVCARAASAPTGTAAPSECRAELAQLSTELVSSHVAVSPMCTTGGSGILGMIAPSGSPPPTPMVPRAAIPTAVGQTITATFTAADVRESDGAASRDYLLLLAAGEAVTIVARGGPMRATPSSNLDMLVSLVSQVGTEVARDDDSAGSLNSRIVYTAPSAGIYIVRVRTYGASLREGQYTIQSYAGSLPSQT